MAEQSILLEAQGIVHETRRASYGHPWANHSRSGRIIGALLDGWLRQVPGFERMPVFPDIPPRLICHMMVATKLSRDVNASKRDNLVDIAGYAENAQMCLDFEATLTTETT